MFANESGAVAAAGGTDLLIAWGHQAGEVFGGRCEDRTMEDGFADLKLGEDGPEIGVGGRKG